MLRSLCLLFFVIIFYSNSYSQESKIFWIDQGSYKIQSSSLSGGNVTDIVTGLQLPTGIAVDCTSTPKKIYYSETGASRIMRANFDGSNQEEVVTGIGGVREVELDLINRKIYWAKDTYSDDRIQRADMDSLNSNVEDVWTNSYGLHGLYGIGLDISNNFIFWTQTRYGLVDVIKRKTFGGAGDTIIGDFRNPKDIDVMGNYLYWSWYSEDFIMRSNKSCSVDDTILTNVSSLFLAVDTISAKIYWGDNTYDKISCCDLDGSNRTDLVTGLYHPVGIALYVNPLTVGIEDYENDTPAKYELSQNYPNPFNPITNIQFSIPKSEFVSLKIYNSIGQEITTLVSDVLHVGKHILQWDASQFASGVYYYKLQVGTNQFSEAKKLILLK